MREKRRPPVDEPVPLITGYKNIQEAFELEGQYPLDDLRARIIQTCEFNEVYERHMKKATLRPCRNPPGSPERIAELARRYRHLEPLWHKDDLRDYEGADPSIVRPARYVRR